MALGRQSRNQRRSPRVDVLLRVRGELVPVSVPITIVNLNRTGFAVLSEVRFRAGERLDFRLTRPRGPAVHVSAVAVHTQSRPDSACRYLTGFTFQPGRSSGAVPAAAISELIAAVAPPGFQV